MKKVLSLTLVSLTITFICSCEQNSDVFTLTEIASLETTVSVKDFAISDSFIDVTVEKSGSLKDLTDTDVAKLKAATYRFYSNVEVKDEKFICHIKDGKSINISELLFKDLNNNLIEMNDDIEELQQKGVTVEFPNMEEYLSLLLTH